MRGSHVKSDNTHTIIKHTPLNPYTWHLRLDLQQLLPFYSLSQPHHVMASNHSPGDNNQSTWGRSERTQGQAKMASWNSFSYICTMALLSFRSFAHRRAASTVIPLSPKATFTPSIQPNLGLPRTRPPLTSASNTLLLYGTHPFFPHAQTISILSDLLYSLTPFLFQFSYVPLHYKLYPFVTLQ